VYDSIINKKNKYLPTILSKIWTDIWPLIAVTTAQLFGVTSLFSTNGYIRDESCKIYFVEITVHVQTLNRILDVRDGVWSFSINQEQLVR